MAASTEEVPRPYGRGTSSVVSILVAMNRVDGVDLVVDLVDVDLDVDRVDVDLDVDLVDVDLVVLLFSGCFYIFWPPATRLFFRFLASGCFKVSGPRLY